MKIKLAHYFAISTISLAATIASAQTVNPNPVLIAPTCLLANVRTDYTILGTKNNLALIEIKEKNRDQFIAAKHNQKTACGGFIDVTADYNSLTTTAHMTPSSYLESRSLTKNNKLSASYQIRYQNEVAQALSRLNPQEMWKNLGVLTSQADRYANSQTGLETAHWLKATVETLAKNNNRNDVSVYLVETGRFKQPSVVAKIGMGNAPGIVIGAHMDTLSSTFSRKPGADDDGSGTVTVLETLRTLFASNIQLTKPVYFIWYAAEEQGLVGSGYVVSDFKNKKIPVDAIIHFDMTGYTTRGDDNMWLISDYVDKNLTHFLETLITTYVDKPVKYTRCGYACSDHASWTQGGYVAAMPAETAFENTNPDLHTSRDTMDKLSLSRMTSYAKLAVAFVIEMAEPVKK